MGDKDQTLKARPTVYKGIRMRSRLEAGYAAWLDEIGFRWDYEPCAFSDETGRQYLPDFRIHDVWVLGRPAPATVYVEVKPAGWADNLDNLPAYMVLLQAMPIILGSEPDAILLLESPASNDVPHAMTEVLLWSAQVDRYWPMEAAWCPVHPDGSRLNGGIPRLGIATPAPRNVGPWFEEWWKGQVA